eukprot:2549169-Rhodomonas_salina.3
MHTVLTCDAHGAAQAKDIPTANPCGLANAYVQGATPLLCPCYAMPGTDLARALSQILFHGHSEKTHPVKWSNSPTWDTTLETKKMELPCLGWPGNTDLDLEEEEDDDKKYKW